MTSSLKASTLRPLRIGMFGGGTVGCDVYGIIMDWLGDSGVRQQQSGDSSSNLIVMRELSFCLSIRPSAPIIKPFPGMIML